jgi:hypothetical protein
MPEEKTNNGASSTSTLTQLIPAQITGLYIAIHTAAASTHQFDFLLPYIVVGIAIMFYFGAPRLLGITTWQTRILYCATFFVWAVNFEVQKIAADLAVRGYDSETVHFVIAVATLMWTAGLTIFYANTFKTSNQESNKAGPSKPTTSQ